MIRCLLTYFLCFCFVFNLKSQNYSYRQYTTDDGLPTNYVYGAIEDDEGYIWVYTENGISKFDGYTFQNFSTADGLPHNDVYYMQKDRFGTLWCRTLGNTATYIEGDSIHQVNFKKGKLSGYREMDGYVLHGGGNTVYLFNKNILLDSFPSIPKDLNRKLGSPELISCRIQPIKRDEYVGICMDRSIYLEYKNKELKSFPIASDFLSSHVSFTHSDIGHSINAFASKNGALLIKPEAKDHRFYLWKDLLGEKIKHSQFDINNPGKLIGLTNKGYVFFDENLGVGDIFQPKAITDKYTLHRLFFDSRGNYWIGTREGGVFFISHEELKTEIVQSKEPRDWVIEKLFERDGVVYAVSDNTNIYKLKEEGLELLYKNPNPSNFNAFTKLRNGDLFFSRGIYPILVWQKGAKKMTAQDSEEKLKRLWLKAPTTEIVLVYKDIVNLKAMAFNEEQNTFLFTHFYGTYAFDFEEEKPTMVLKGKGAEVIFTDTINGKTYLTDVNQLYCYENDSLKKVRTFSDAISVIHVKDKDHLWVGTQNDGLYEWAPKGKELKRVSARKLIKGIDGDDLYFYIACNKGVAKVEEENGHFREVYCYDKKDGLPSTEVFDVLVDEEFIYAATIQGVARIKKNFPTPPPDTLQRLHIITFLANDSIQSQNKAIRLQRDQNNIDIHYYLQHYGSKGAIQYSYKLYPVQEDWQVTEQRNVNFPGLPPDDYRFELKAKDHLGQEYYLDRGLKFTIEKSWWQKGWFQILAVLSIGSFLFYILRKREQRQRQKLALEKKLNDRIAELQMQSLRAQMNPHFIFNALGSIQYFIQTHRTDEADEYLTMFARLMRKYLDSATERVIDLNTEIDLLKEYTRLEMMRFDWQFKTSLDVSPEVDVEQESIPSMMLQPFVENAINHGLQQRMDKNGELNIYINKSKNNALVCTISDNGIGRKNAATHKRKGHKSRGMKNIQDRIETLRANALSHITIAIEDLDASNKKYPGTKVVITFNPLNDEEV